MVQYRQTNKRAIAERENAKGEPTSGVRRAAPRVEVDALGQAEQSLLDAREAIDQALASLRAVRAAG